MNDAIKKIFAMVLMVMGVIGAFAAQDAAIAFSTRGPDRYADGTSVMVGECYALVWMKNGSEFKGVDMDGKAVDAENNAVVVALPLAKARRNGAVHCPATLFQIDSAFAAAHADGSFALILLDTRVSNGKGGLVPSGNSHKVQGWGFVAKSRVKAVAGSMTSSANAGAEEGTVSEIVSAIPDSLNLPRPRITDISVKDGFVTLTVVGTSPRLLYNIAAGSAPDRLISRHVAAAVQGRDHADCEIKIVTPVSDGINFFKIVRN